MKKLVEKKLRNKKALLQAQKKRFLSSRNKKHTMTVQEVKKTLGHWVKYLKTKRLGSS